MFKTFLGGVGGWADTQLPDSTVEFTSPSGRTYTTESAGSQFFPILATAPANSRSASRAPNPSRVAG